MSTMKNLRMGIVVCALMASEGLSDVLAQRAYYRDSCLTGTYQLDLRRVF